MQPLDCVFYSSKLRLKTIAKLCQMCYNFTIKTKGESDIERNNLGNLKTSSTQP